MAGLGDLLQRISRSLEEASAQQPGDDLRARLGYGTGDEDDDDASEGSIWEPEAEPRPESSRVPDTARATGTTRKAEPRRAPAHETLRSFAGGYRAPPSEVVARVGRLAPAAPPRRPHAPPESLLSERVRARLRTPDALREAFVVKEILDRPLARRRRR